MQGLDDPPRRRLVITDPARHAMACLCRVEGRQAVVLSWPGGATYLPVVYYKPGEYDVVVGHLARCPIYADLRQLGWFGSRRVVLDIAEPPRPGRRPLLRVRHADRATSVAEVAV
jgi:hypothetical protein